MAPPVATIPNCTTITNPAAPIILHRITTTHNRLTALTPVTIRNPVPITRRPISSYPVVLQALTTPQATIVAVMVPVVVTIPHRTPTPHTTTHHLTAQPITTTTQHHTTTHRLHTTMSRTTPTHTTETTSRITTQAITHPNRTSTTIPIIIAHMTTPTITPTTRPLTNIEHHTTTAPK